MNSRPLAAAEAVLYWMFSRQEAGFTRVDNSQPSFLVRNEFLIRRLHSFRGLIPVGAYMVIHLLTNASVLDSPATFQRTVYTIHSLGKSCRWWSGRSSSFRSCSTRSSAW